MSSRCAAKRRRKRTLTGRSTTIKERRYGSFTRSIGLPTAVVADKADAQFENGILTLRLPKAEEVMPKTITVKARVVGLGLRVNVPPCRSHRRDVRCRSLWPHGALD